jgi:hypothetical protein
MRPQHLLLLSKTFTSESIGSTPTRSLVLTMDLLLRITRRCFLCLSWLWFLQCVFTAQFLAVSSNFKAGDVIRGSFGMAAWLEPIIDNRTEYHNVAAVMYGPIVNFCTKMIILPRQARDRRTEN